MEDAVYQGVALVAIRTCRSHVKPKEGCRLTLFSKVYADGHQISTSGVDWKPPACNNEGCLTISG